MGGLLDNATVSMVCPRLQKTYQAILLGRLGVIFTEDEAERIVREYNTLHAGHGAYRDIEHTEEGWVWTKDDGTVVICPPYFVWNSEPPFYTTPLEWRVDVEHTPSPFTTLVREVALACVEVPECAR